jgi:hypothetical protein
VKEYNKIEVIYNRDMEGTKKLIEGSFRNEAVEYLKDLPWIFTEKIDGTNIGIVWDGHKVTYQGRTQSSSIQANVLNKLLELFGTNEVEELFEQKFGEMNVILYGEGYGAGVQKGGGNYRKDVSFILFDVYIPEQDLYLKRDSVEDIAKTFGIDVVPIILTGTINDAVEFVKTNPKSTIGNANMEGVVGHPLVELRDRLNKRMIVKIKVCDFNK